MDFIMEGRASDSPYIDTIWRGRAGNNYAPTCPADGHWNLLFLKQQGKVKVTVEGPLTKAKFKTHPEGTEWLVIRFKLGIFLSSLPIKNLVDGDVILPDAASQSFWLHGSAWQLPDYENAEAFVNQLVRAGLLLRDPLVNTVLQDQPKEISSRTVRRHFLLATGLTPRIIEQIERAQRAAALLEQGVPILDVVDQAGYADQPHMTRSLKRFIGYTPAQIARLQSGE